MHAHGGQHGEVQEFWEELYGGQPQRFSGKVNPVLAHEAAALAPGTVLDLGCGEGGDAVWLAQQGWRVTAVDISEVALERAASAAAAVGVADRITFEHRDLDAAAASGSFDLVSAQFLQSPVALARNEVLRAGAAAVAPGGSMLVVAHAALPPWSNHEDHADLVLPTPESDLAALQLEPGTWDVIRHEVFEREVTRPDGQSGPLLDSVLLVSHHPT